MNVTISNSILTAIINPKGAELVSLKKNSKEFMWEGNPKYWGKHSPVLFPIVGTLKNNSFTYNDKIFQLLRHGFARDNDFQIVNQTETQVVFSLKASDETLKSFPFLFELQLIYTLIENKLSIGYKITNHDTVTIPFSIGAHPAFALPNNFENYSLEFNKQETLNCYILENDLLSDTNFPIELNNKKITLSFSLFENDALIFKQLHSKEISILENNVPFLKVKFDAFPSLGIWTKMNAPFVCIEPWLGYSDTVNASGNILEKEAIQLVEKNQSFDCQFNIEIL